jgi:dihydrofolate synthase / folylpolyglutamate synthase
VGPLVDSAPQVELWLDGGHNPAGGAAVAATLARMPARETHLICGMLNTKDVRGYMEPLVGHVARLHAVTIPGEANTLPAEVTRDAALAAGMDAVVGVTVAGALADVAAASPRARVLICGSLYLAGSVLRENG